MIEWLAMGGHGFYIWSAYGLTALLIAIELRQLQRRRRAAWRQFDALRDESGPDPRQ
ncbi:MAG: heme exporter protein CcmD [Burkholderiaceae bacterium]